MKRSEAFPSRYLGKDDVTSPFTATIQDVVFEAVKGEHGDEQKAVMWFNNDYNGKSIKPMILNNTNWLNIEAAYGDDTDMWKGKQIEIYVDPTIMFAGKRIGGVRVRTPHSNGQSAVPAPVRVAWTLDMAIANCHQVGISRDNLIDAIKAKGFTGWKADRDTPMVQAMIEQTKSGAEQPFETLTYTNDEIPF